MTNLKLTQKIVLEKEVYALLTSLNFSRRTKIGVLVKSLYYYALEMLSEEELKSLAQEPVGELRDFLLNYPKDAVDIVDPLMVNALVKRQYALAQEQGWKAVLRELDYQEIFEPICSIYLYLEDITWQAVQHSISDGVAFHAFIESTLLEGDAKEIALALEIRPNLEEFHFKRRFLFTNNLRLWLERHALTKRQQSAFINAVLKARLLDKD